MSGYLAQLVFVGTIVLSSCAGAGQPSASDAPVTEPAATPLAPLPASGPADTLVPTASLTDHSAAETNEIEGAITADKPGECPSDPGAPTDLSSEPRGWLGAGSDLRWTDLQGCSVRVDVISHIRGADHCDFQSAEYITIGPTLGQSIVAEQIIRSDAHRFIWDPSGAIDGRPYGQEIEALPNDAFDTGYRQDGNQMWLSSSTPLAFYRVTDTAVEAWHLSATLDFLGAESPNFVSRVHAAVSSLAPVM